MRHLGRALLGLVLGFCLTIGVNATASQIASRNGVVDLSSAQTVTGNKTLSGTTTIGGQKWSVTTTAASATNTQAAATLLSVGFNIITAAASAYAVKLPLTTAAGDVIFTFNAGDGTLNVYPSTGDRILPYSANTSLVISYNDFGMWVSTASGVWRKASMMTNFAESYALTKFVWGDQNGIIAQFTSTGKIFLNNVTSFAVQNEYSVTTGITAGGTHSQAGATATTLEVSEVTTVATASDAVKLKTAVGGNHQVLVNRGAKAFALWPQTGDQTCYENTACDAVDAVMSTTIAPNAAVECWAKDATTWYCRGSALSTTDSTGTPGAATANTARGQAKIAATAGSVVITNSLVTAASVVTAVLQATDAGCTFIQAVVPAAGSFTINVNAVCTGNTQVGWVVWN